MGTEIRLSIFRNAFGQERGINYICQELLQRSTYGEGHIQRIGVITPRGIKSFILKDMNVEKIAIAPFISPEEQLRKWFDLKQAGVTVVPTFRINNTSILETDLTKDGKYELFDPSNHWKFSARFMDNPLKYQPPPEWFFQHKREILRRIIDNARKAANINCRLMGDSYMCVYDTILKNTEVVVADLGQGVYLNSADAAGNPHSALIYLRGMELCSDEEIQELLGNQRTR